MLRAALGSLLLGVVACSAPPSPPDGGAAEDDAGAADAGGEDAGEQDGPRMVRVSPSTLSLRWDRAVIELENAPREFGYYRLSNTRAGDAYVSSVDGGGIVVDWFGRKPGKFDLVLYELWLPDGGYVTDGGRVLSRLFDAGEFVPTAAEARLDAGGGNLAVPLAPALAGPCSRRLNFTVSNAHDERLGIFDVSVDGGGFSIRYDNCADAGLSWQDGSETCSFQVCFGSAASGPHTAEVRVVTSAGVRTAPVTATVSAPWTGLDPAFQDGGSFLLGTSESFLFAANAAATVGEGLAVSTVYGLHHFVEDGGHAYRTGSLPELDGGIGDTFGRYLDLAGEAGRLYATVNTNNNYGKLIALTPELSFDTAFASTGFIDVTFSVFQGRVVATNAQGTVFVAGSTGILALDSAGAPLSSFGQQGIVSISGGPKELVCDGAGRLVSLQQSGTATLTRYDGASGVVDFTRSNLFASNVVVGAQDELLVDYGGVSVVTDAGVTVLSAQSGVKDLAVDGAGRILVGNDGGVTRLTATGAFDRSWALPGVVFVRCPAAGRCYVVGDTGEESYVARLEP